MQKSNKKQKKEVEVSEGSDSEPSVDCFELTELEDQIGAALEHEDAGINPFEKPEQDTVEVVSDDVASIESLKVITS